MLPEESDKFLEFFEVAKAKRCGCRKERKGGGITSGLKEMLNDWGDSFGHGGSAVEESLSRLKSARSLLQALDLATCFQRF